MKQSYWLLWVGKELWLVSANHATVKLDSSVTSRGIKTYSQARIELQNLQKSSQFFVIRSAQWAEKLGCCPEYCRSWKIRSENLWLWSTWRPFDSERSVSDGGNLCSLPGVPCGQWFANQFEIVWETPFGCDTVGRELLWAVLYLLLCHETDWNVGIGKQGYVFILSDFKKWRYDVSHS